MWVVYFLWQVSDLLKKVYPLFPIIGMGVYLILFFITIQAYEGGSGNLPDASGYSFFHNFLCDVTSATIHNGTVNKARSLGIVAHLALSFTMISFFYLLPNIFPVQNRNTRWVRAFGMLTMSVFILMFTTYHDLIVTITGILGTIALIPFFIEMHKQPWDGIKRLAYFCYLLSIVVFFIFQTKIGFYYLPFLQKIAFLFDGWWVIWVSLIVMRKNAKEKVSLARA